jgi:hypothetical protein
MVKKPKNTVIISDFSQFSFNFNDINAGIFVPSYIFLYDFLKKRIINLTDFGIFQILMKVAYIDKKGELSFKMSNADIRELCGSSKQPVMNALLNLEGLGLIRSSPAMKGLASTIKISLETLRFHNKKYMSQKELGTCPEKGKVPNNDTGDMSQNETGTYPESGEHLYTKVLKVSLCFENRFYDQERRNKLRSDLMRLAKKGFDMDAVASFLEVNSLEGINSFYAVISAKKDQLAEIHAEVQKLKAKKEAASRGYSTPEIPSNLPEIRFKLPALWEVPDPDKDASKMKFESFGVMRGVDFSNYLDDVQEQ